MVTIQELSSVREHLPIIGTWIHQTFWEESAKSVDDIQRLLKSHLPGTSIPTTLIAINGNSKPVGSVCFMKRDMEERPMLTPWLAALFVQPAYRKRGIGSQLVNALIQRARNAGYERLCLSADDHVALYARLGFNISETGVGPNQLTIMQRTLIG